MEMIGDRIKAKRKELGLTQLALAEKLNVTDRAVSKWEQNEGNPDFSLLPILAETLGVSLDYLIAGKVVEPVISLDDMDASKRAILLAKKDDVLNFKKYGYISDTVFLSPSTREYLKSNYQITTPQYEDEVCKIVFEGKKEKIFVELLKAYINPESPTRTPKNFRTWKALGNYGNDFVFMSILTSQVSGLELVDFHFTSGNQLSKFKDQAVSDKILDYICKFEFLKQVQDSNGKSQYIVSNIHDKVLDFLYATQRFERLKAVMGTLYTNLEKVAKQYTPQNNDNYRTITFTGSEVVEEDRWRGNTDRHILGVVPRIYTALDSAIKNYDYEWIEIFNKYHKSISDIFSNGRTGFLTDEDLHALRLHQDGTLSKYEYVSLDCTRLELLAYRSVVLFEHPNFEKEENVDVLKKCLKNAEEMYENVIDKGFIHYIELVETLVNIKDYRKLFEFSCNNNLQQLTDVILEKNDEKILQTAKALFLPPEPYYSQIVNLEKELNTCTDEDFFGGRRGDISRKIDHFKNEYFAWIDHNLPEIYNLIKRQSSIVPLEEYCSVSGSFIDYCKKMKRKYYTSYISKIEEKIEKITKEKELQSEYDSVISTISNNYLQELFEKGDYELLIIKLCSRMDVELKYRRYDGEDFHARMQAYFDNGPKSRDMDDGWGYMVLDTEWEEKEVKPWNAQRDLCNRLRMQRNNIAHGEKTKVQELTKTELQECLNFVLSFQK